MSRSAASPVEAPSAAYRSPRGWLVHRYWPLAWGSLIAAVVAYLFDGGELEWLMTLAFLILNAVAWLVDRRNRSLAIGGHAFLLFLLFAWYCGHPDSIPASLGQGPLVFVSLLLIPNLIVVSLFGIRASIVTGGLMAGMFVALGPVEAEMAVGLFLIVASSLVGGLFLNRVFRDLETTYRVLSRAAAFDYLTGLGNRRAFESDYGAFVARAHRRDAELLLTLWDIDGLKSVNDRHGHGAGDAYILEFTKALRAATRTDDGLYRIGGDEFIGLHVGADTVKDIRDRVHRLFPMVSVGWTRADDTDSDTALRLADQRMYVAKSHPSRQMIELHTRVVVDARDSGDIQIRFDPARDDLSIQ